MSEFQLPKGYRAWCHICADPPFNKKTNVEGQDIPGVGFPTMEELNQHTKELHRVWKG